MVIVMIKPKVLADRQEIRLRRESEVSIELVELRSEVACEKDVGNRKNKSPTLTARVQIGLGGVEEVVLQGGRLERSEHLNVNQWTRIIIFEVGREGENGAYAASAIAYVVRKKIRGSRTLGRKLGLRLMPYFSGTSSFEPKCSTVNRQERT